MDSNSSVNDGNCNGQICSTHDGFSLGKSDLENVRSAMSQLSSNGIVLSQPVPISDALPYQLNSELSSVEDNEKFLKCSMEPALNGTGFDQNACINVSGGSGKLSLSLVIDNESTNLGSVLCPYSPQTPCSQFKSCVLDGVGHCGGIAGAALCRWDMIVGRKVMHIWATSAERRIWLAQPDMLGFVAHFTVVSEVLRSPRNEAKFFASPSDGIVLASFLFDACPNEEKNPFLSSDSLMTHSISVVLPHSELSNFLTLKTVCLEWLGRTAMELRLRLAKDVEAAYSWFGQAFTEFLMVVDSLQLSRVPSSVPLAETAFYPDHSFNMVFVRQAVTAHLYQCQQTIVVGSSVSRINLMVATLSKFVLPTCRDRCRYAVEGSSVKYSPELCVQGLLKNSDWNQQLATLENVVYCSRYPTALVDVTECEILVICAPYEFSAQQHKFKSTDLRHVWNNKPSSTQNVKGVFGPLVIKESLVEGCFEMLQLLPLSLGVQEAFIETFMASLQRKALAVIQFVAVETDRGKKLHRSALLARLREVFELKRDGDLMAVLCAAERLRPGVLNLVCGT